MKVGWSEHKKKCSPRTDLMTYSFEKYKIGNLDSNHNAKLESHKMALKTNLVSPAVLREYFARHKIEWFDGKIEKIDAYMSENKEKFSNGVDYSSEIMKIESIPVERQTSTSARGREREQRFCEVAHLCGTSNFHK